MIEYEAETNAQFQKYWEEFSEQFVSTLVIERHRNEKQNNTKHSHTPKMENEKHIQINYLNRSA